MEGRRILGIVLVLLGVAFVVLTSRSIYALPLAIIVPVLGILLILRIGSGGELFPAIREQMEFRTSMKEAEARPGPACWRCHRQNRPFAWVGEGCGAELSP